MDIGISDQVASAAYTLKDLKLNDVITVSQGTIMTEHPVPVLSSITQTWSPHLW